MCHDGMENFIIKLRRRKVFDFELLETSITI